MFVGGVSDGGGVCGKVKNEIGGRRQEEVELITGQ